MFATNLVSFSEPAEYWENLLNIANKYMENGMYSDAIKSYNEILTNTPDIPEVYNNLGIAYEKTGYNDKALESYKKALELKPGFPEVLNNLAGLYLKLNIHIDIAMAYAIKAVSIDERPNFFDTLGDVFERRRVYDKAIEYYLKAIKKDPEKYSSYMKLIKVYIKKGRLEKATHYMNELVKSGFESMDFLLLKVHLLKKTNHYADAHVELSYLINRYRDMEFSLDDEEMLSDEVRCYFYTTLWTAALSYYRAINPDIREITFDDIEKYLPWFYYGKVPRKDSKGHEFLINRNYYVECETHGINPDIFEFNGYFSQEIREIFERICKRNQLIIKAALKAYSVTHDITANTDMESISAFIPVEISCPQKGEYTIKDGEITCGKHGKLY
ncbi:MAG: hypothetical protein C0601_08960 [Candidatus Muiribacterium halophilum]|uniref:Uncharacterized protein n=1 Tax=Muiribacterium halophilum TaxID=2053465 RepID=A0A2N5ZE11_MUIH1|nr:MAG: hypothetical protein C0601_08960 [Candidatus Muirbacterium halophilum]